MASLRCVPGAVGADRSDSKSGINKEPYILVYGVVYMRGMKQAKDRETCFEGLAVVGKRLLEEMKVSLAQNDALTLGASTQRCDYSTLGNGLCQSPDFLAQRTSDDFLKVFFSFHFFSSMIVPFCINISHYFLSEITCPYILDIVPQAVHQQIR